MKESRNIRINKTYLATDVPAKEGEFDVKRAQERDSWEGTMKSVNIITANFF